MAEAVAFDPPLAGHCLCGAVSVHVLSVRPGVDVCHCEMCAKWCGGPFFSLHGVSRDAFTLSGEDAVNRFDSSNWAERASCSRCGSNLWFHFKPDAKWSFMAGLFDLPPDWQVDDQIFVDEMPRYAELAADGPKKTGAEIIAEAKAAGFAFD